MGRVIDLLLKIFKRFFMKKLIIPLLIILGIPFRMFGEISFLDQSIREYNALITDPRMTQILSSNEEIISIERGRRLFVVKTNHHAFEVTVIYEKISKPGPTPFRFEFANPVPARGR
jgi:hypothetical protein